MNNVGIRKQKNEHNKHYKILKYYIILNFFNIDTIIINYHLKSFPID